MPIKIHGKEYITVAERVAAFRKRYPEGAIITTYLGQAQTTDYVVMNAMVYFKADGPVNATGYAEEVRGSSQINKTSALENCETSAIGRALAAAGFGVEAQYASANEVQQAIHQQNDARLPADQVFTKGQYIDCTIGWVWPRDPAYIDRISSYKSDPLGAACADYIAEHAAEHAEKMLDIRAKKEAKAKEKQA